MKPGEFHMPGKKVMQSSDTLAKVVLIDGTPSSRTNGPKKGTQALQRQKEALYPENAVDCRPKAFVYGN